jgi:hypothetical protein
MVYKQTSIREKRNNCDPAVGGPSKFRSRALPRKWIGQHAEMKGSVQERMFYCIRCVVSLEAAAGTSSLPIRVLENLLIDG